MNRKRIEKQIILTALASSNASFPSSSLQFEAAATTMIRANAKMSFILLEFLEEQVS